MRLSGLIILLLLAITNQAQAIDSRDIDPDLSFKFDNELFCTVVKSNDGEEGAQLTIINLRSESPYIIYESGAKTFMKKLFSDDSTLTLQFSPLGAGGTTSRMGGVEAIIIDTRRGLFARVSAGN